MSDHTVEGTVAEGFEPVREEFEAFLAGEEHPPEAQLAVHRDGERVVDLWAGAETTADSLAPVYSITKGAAHFVVALLVQEGVLDLDGRVAEHWPEFAAHGKGDLTLRQLVTHQAGVVNIDAGLTVAELADDRVAAALLAEQKPAWEPGGGYGYHAFVIGALTGEVVRRATGRTIQQIFEERVRAPYRLDFFLGLPAGAEGRCLPILPMLPTPAQQAELAAAAPPELLAHSFLMTGDQPVDLVDFVNTRHVRALGQASAGGVGNARGIAAFYSAVVSASGGRPPLLSPATLDEVTRLQVTGTDLVTGEPDHFLLGFENLPLVHPSLSPRSFGHSGAAGSLALADAGRGLSYAYVRRRFAYPGGAAPENARLIEAVTASADR
ncbi:serine hydrolase domain-containing protein [Actinocorallia longicatena]|uniref:Serine hydrolase domain-containing protein n=1 Tax=Actinocorallia longicatena TaxID=111803 RepID=A0ABP6Q0P8_9ACTN